MVSVTTCDRVVRGSRLSRGWRSLADVDRPDARELYEADAALIRPDQIVAWRGSAPCDALRMIAIATGQRAAPRLSGNIRALA